MNTVDSKLVSPLLITKENCWFPTRNTETRAWNINDTSKLFQYGRKQCSMIEVIIIALTSDPFIQHFASSHYEHRITSLGSFTKVKDGETGTILEDTDEKDGIVLGRRERGQLLLLILNKRMTNTKEVVDSTKWKEFHGYAYMRLRKWYNNGSDMKDVVHWLNKIHADISAYLLHVAANARIVQLYIQNGFRVITKRSSYCLHCKQTYVEYYHHGDNVKYVNEVQDLTLVEMNPLFAPFKLETDSNLSTLMKEQFKGNWKVCMKQVLDQSPDVHAAWESESTCRTSDCSRATGCIEREQIMNLPSMLYLRFERGTKVKLSYKRDSLVLGPTMSGQYAEYELVSRIRWTSVTFTKQTNSQTKKYENFVEMYQNKCERYSFDVIHNESEEPLVEDMDVPLEVDDTSSSVLIWKRKV
jgi:hypothetical protein